MRRTAEKMEYVESGRGGEEIQEKKSKSNVFPSGSGEACGGTNNIWELWHVDKNHTPPVPHQLSPQNGLNLIDDNISTVEQLQLKFHSIADATFEIHYEYIFIRQETRNLVSGPFDENFKNTFERDYPDMLGFWKYKCINMMMDNLPAIHCTKIQRRRDFTYQICDLNVTDS